MAYEKRLCILKQMKKGFTADGGPITGAVYAERLGRELTVTPRIAGLSPLSEGRYMLVVQAGGMYYSFGLKGNEALKAGNAPSVSEGFSALLCFVGREPEPIAFGRCGNAPEDFTPLLRALTEREERKSPLPVPMPPNQIPGSPSPQVPLAPAVPLPEEEPLRDAAGYDDEAIADANFYSVGPAGESGNGSEKEPARSPFRITRRGLTYYNKVADKLKAAFEKYPRDTSLLASIPHSEWVKTEQALLGVVYAEGLPRYLCVALKDPPPDEAKAASVFVPAGLYNDNDGYYVVFQDADTGEYVTVEQS